MAVLDSDIDPDDIVGEFTRGRPRNVPQEAFDMIAAQGLDASSESTYRGEVDFTGGPPPLLEHDLLNPKTKSGQKFFNASKALLEIFPDTDFGSAQTQDSMILGGGDDTIPIHTDPTDEQISEWGLGLISFFNSNFLSTIINVNRLDNAPAEQKAAMLTMMDMVEEKQPSTAGIGRFFKGVLTDPSTYGGLATLGLGVAAGASVKEATRQGFRAMLKKSLKHTSLLAAEGGLFTAAEDIGRQSVEMMGTGDGELALEKFDLPRTAISTGVGLGLGGLLGVGGSIAPEVARRVRRQFPKKVGKQETDVNAPKVTEARKEAAKIPDTIDIKTPERRRAREAQVNKMANPENREIAQNNEIVIVLGPPAAGKSTIADPLVEMTKSVLNDSDIVKKRFKQEFAGGIGAPALHLESDEIMMSALEISMNRGDNIVLPLVGKNQDKIKSIIQHLQEFDYRTHLVLVDLPIEEAAGRAVTRLYDIGRFVDPEYVLSIKDFPSKTYEALKKTVDSYVKYSNDVPIGTAPKLIESEVNKPLEYRVKSKRPRAVKKAYSDITRRRKIGEAKKRPFKDLASMTENALDDFLGKMVGNREAP
jgi:adenylate kinase family enzyme